MTLRKHSKPEYAMVKRTEQGYSAYFKGRFYGTEATREAAWALLWDGPIGDELLAFHREMAIKWAICLEERRRRKEITLGTAESRQAWRDSLEDVQP